jgi:TrmH family RNA methyltransferase
VADAPLSPRNARVTAARRLLRARTSEHEGRFLAEGPQAVREALQSDRAVDVVHETFVSATGRARHADLVDRAMALGIRVDDVDDATMADLAGTVTPQGIVAVCSRVDVPLDAVLARSPRLVAFLAQVRDPGNAGTVIRTADAAGADAVVVSDSSVDVHNPKAVRASAGSLFHLPISLDVHFAVALDRLRTAGLRVLAADAAGERDLDDEADAGGLDGPTVWVFGNEAWGLPADVRDACDAVVHVPIHGRAESLNLATAAAVCLYASARAHRHGHASP